MENALGQSTLACVWENDSEELGRRGAGYNRAAQGLSACYDYCVQLSSFLNSSKFLG